MTDFENLTGRLKNFFREDTGEVVGVYHDGQTIFLARIYDGLETDEVNFSINPADEIPAVEQLAEKVYMVCSKRGWTTSQLGLCLMEGATVTLLRERNVPANELGAAVEIWAKAQVGEAAAYTFVEEGGQIWMESLPLPSANEYVTAWAKNFLTLCALTTKPILSEEPPPETGMDKAFFVAKVLAERKSPNLLKTKTAAWNLKKFSVLIAAIFFIAAIFLSAKIFYDCENAADELELAREILERQSEDVILKKNIDDNIETLQNLNDLLAAQPDPTEKFNALVNIGRIADGEVVLKKIRAAENFLELEGTADNAGDIRKYLSRIKNSVSPNAKLEHSAENAGEIIFTIRIHLDN